MKGANAVRTASAARRAAQLGLWVALAIAISSLEGWQSLIHISEPTRRTPTSYAVFCLKKKKKKRKKEIKYH